MNNHSRRTIQHQDVVCTALKCELDADERYLPAPLCQYHAEEVHRIVEANRRHVMDEMRPRVSPERNREEEMRKFKRATQSVVYYIQFGQGIKIGTTRNMQQRLSSFCLTESSVLATEPGSYDLERSRHEFFKELRIGRSEVFTDSPKIRKHIEAVKKYHGEPLITAYV